MNAQVKWIVGVLAAIVVLVGAGAGLGLFGGPSDKELIKVALDEAIQASKEGRPGGVLELISQRFAVNGESYGTRDISKTIKDMKPDVAISNPEPTVKGNSATITSGVNLSVMAMTTNIPDVTLKFAKESGTKWLIFPTKKWRLVEVSIPNTVIDEVRSKFSDPMQL